MGEKEIIEQIRQGDTRLFASVVKSHSAEIFSKVLALVKREDLAQEITQQAFVRTYTRLDDWRGQSLKTWITTIAMHLALNALDKERRHRKEELDENAPRQAEEYSEERELLLQRLEKAINELQPNDQAVIRLHYYEKRKTEEIASRLNMSKSNVLVRLHRIREQLKKKLNNGINE